LTTISGAKSAEEAEHPRIARIDGCIRKNNDCSGEDALRDGLAAVVRGASQYEIVAKCPDGEAALDQIRRLAVFLGTGGAACGAGATVTLERTENRSFDYSFHVGAEGSVPSKFCLCPVEHNRVIDGV
jgi:hypothetical protein